VARVYDGDTLTLSGGERVRLRYVNTPEIKPPQPFAEAARDRTAAFVGKHKIRLHYGTVSRDSYGRLLADIESQKRDLAEHLLEEGLAHLFVVPPVDRNLAPLRDAQERARSAGRGIWGDPAFRGPLVITSFHANAAGDDRTHVNGETLRVCNVSSTPIPLNDFTLREQSGRTWPLPPLALPPGYTVKIHSGSGTHAIEPSAPMAVYLGSDRPIWNNDHDRAEIVDRSGRVVSAWTHHGTNDAPKR
jgi:endonuclease YncB( thermonuclease family)